MFGLIPRTDTMHVYNPFRELEALERAFFADPFPSFFRSTSLPQYKTDITDQGDHFLLETDLPGFEKKDISLEIKEDTLTVSAQKSTESESKDEQEKFIRRERSYGAYSRSYDISGVDADGIKAKLENGVLQLTLPKKVQPQPESRKLEIE